MAFLDSHLISYVLLKQIILIERDGVPEDRDNGLDDGLQKDMVAVKAKRDLMRTEFR